MKPRTRLNPSFGRASWVPLFSQVLEKITHPHSLVVIEGCECLRHLLLTHLPISVLLQEGETLQRFMTYFLSEDIWPADITNSTENRKNVPRGTRALQVERVLKVEKTLAQLQTLHTIVHLMGALYEEVTAAPPSLLAAMSSTPTGLECGHRFTALLVLSRAGALLESVVRLLQQVEPHTFGWLAHLTSQLLDLPLGVPPDVATVSSTEGRCSPSSPPSPSTARVERASDALLQVVVTQSELLERTLVVLRGMTEGYDGSPRVVAQRLLEKAEKSYGMATKWHQHHGEASQCHHNSFVSRSSCTEQLSAAGDRATSKREGEEDIISNRSVTLNQSRGFEPPVWNFVGSPISLEKESNTSFHSPPPPLNPAICTRALQDVAKSASHDECLRRLNILWCFTVAAPEGIDQGLTAEVLESGLGRFLKRSPKTRQDRHVFVSILTWLGTVCRAPHKLNPQTVEALLSLARIHFLVYLTTTTTTQREATATPLSWSSTGVRYSTAEAASNIEARFFDAHLRTSEDNFKLGCAAPSLLPYSIASRREIELLSEVPPVRVPLLSFLLTLSEMAPCACLSVWLEDLFPALDTLLAESDGRRGLRLEVGGTLFVDAASPSTEGPCCFSEELYLRDALLTGASDVTAATALGCRLLARLVQLPAHVLDVELYRVRLPLLIPRLLKLAVAYPTLSISPHEDNDSLSPSTRSSLLFYHPLSSTWSFFALRPVSLCEGALLAFDSCLWLLRSQYMIELVNVDELLPSFHALSRSTRESVEPSLRALYYRTLFHLSGTPQLLAKLLKSLPTAVPAAIELLTHYSPDHSQGIVWSGLPASPWETTEASAAASWLCGVIQTAWRFDIALVQQLRLTGTALPERLLPLLAASGIDDTSASIMRLCAWVGEHQIASSTLALTSVAPAASENTETDASEVSVRNREGWFRNALTPSGDLMLSLNLWKRVVTKCMESNASFILQASCGASAGMEELLPLLANSSGLGDAGDNSKASSKLCFVRTSTGMWVESSPQLSSTPSGVINIHQYSVLCQYATGLVRVLYALLFAPVHAGTFSSVFVEGEVSNSSTVFSPGSFAAWRAAEEKISATESPLSSKLIHGLLTSVLGLPTPDEILQVQTGSSAGMPGVVAVYEEMLRWTSLFGAAYMKWESSTFFNGEPSTKNALSEENRAFDATFDTLSEGSDIFTSSLLQRYIDDFIRIMRSPNCGEKNERSAVALLVKGSFIPRLANSVLSLWKARNGSFIVEPSLADECVQLFEATEACFEESSMMLEKFQDAFISESKKSRDVSLQGSHWWSDGPGGTPLVSVGAVKSDDLLEEDASRLGSGSMTLQCRLLQQVPHVAEAAWCSQAWGTKHLEILERTLESLLTQESDGADGPSSLFLTTFFQHLSLLTNALSHHLPESLPQSILIRLASVYGEGLRCSATREPTLRAVKILVRSSLGRSVLLQEVLHGGNTLAGTVFGRVLALTLGLMVYWGGKGAIRAGGFRSTRIADVESAGERGAAGGNHGSSLARLAHRANVLLGYEICILACTNLMRRPECVPEEEDGETKAFISIAMRQKILSILLSRLQDGEKQIRHPSFFTSLYRETLHPVRPPNLTHTMPNESEVCSSSTEFLLLLRWVAALSFFPDAQSAMYGSHDLIDLLLDLAGGYWRYAHRDSSLASNESTVALENAASLSLLTLRNLCFNRRAKMGICQDLRYLHTLKAALLGCPTVIPLLFDMKLARDKPSPPAPVGEIAGEIPSAAPTTAFLRRGAHEGLVFLHEGKLDGSCMRPFSDWVQRWRVIAEAWVSSRRGGAASHSTSSTASEKTAAAEKTESCYVLDLWEKDDADSKEIEAAVLHQRRRRQLLAASAFWALVYEHQKGKMYIRRCLINGTPCVSLAELRAKLEAQRDFDKAQCTRKNEDFSVHFGMQSAILSCVENLEFLLRDRTES